MNWTIIIIVGIAALGLIVFLIIRNAKDEKDFEKQANQDYPRHSGESDESETGGVGK